MVVVGRRDQDQSFPERLTIASGTAGQLAGAAQDVGEHAGTAGRDVEHDADRRAEIGRKVADHTGQNLDPAGRGAHYDQIPAPVGMRVDSVSFHMDSLRPVSAGYQLRAVTSDE